jgi:hypothetical protein
MVGQRCLPHDSQEAERGRYRDTYVFPGWPTSGLFLPTRSHLLNSFSYELIHGLTQG